MYAKIVLMTAAILLSGQVLAEDSTKPATTPAPAAKEEAVKTPYYKEAFNYMKEKFSASYHGEYYLTRKDITSTNADDKDIQDLSIMHNPTIIYKPFTNWQTMATGEFKYTDSPAMTGSFPNTFFRALFTLTRKNILEEKDYGFGLDAGIGRRQFNTGLPLSSYGNNRIFATVSKKFFKHSGSVFVQYLHNDYKVSSATTWLHALEIIPTVTFQVTEKLSWLMNDDIVINAAHDDNTDRNFSISHELNFAYLNYQWTDKLGTYYQLKYLHGEDFTNGPKDDSVDHYLGASYSFTDKATLTAEIGSKLFAARDGKDLFAENVKYPELAFYLDLAL